MEESSKQERKLKESSLEQSRIPSPLHHDPGERDISARFARYAERLGGWTYDLVRRHWLGMVIFHLLAFVLGAVEAPVLVYLDQPWTAGLVYGFYGLFCHQQPSRCLFLFGAPLAICSRCLAFYLSLLIFALAVGIKRINPISLRSAVMLAGPAALDAFLQAVRLTESTNLVRLTTGLLLGMAVSLYLFPRIQKAVEGLSLPAAEMSPEDTARAWR